MYLSPQYADVQVTEADPVAVLAQVLRQQFADDAPQVAVRQIDLAEGEMRVV